MLGAAPLDDIARLRDILDYRTAIAFLALLTFAVVGLFALLMRAQAKHLATALRLAPLMERTQSVVEANTRVIEQLAAELHDGRQRARDVGAA